MRPEGSFFAFFVGEPLIQGSSRSADGKNFKLLKYEHIVYNFKARGLEISNI